MSVTTTRLLAGRSYACALVALGALFVCELAKPSASQAGVVSFDRDVRPILSENCFQCHGPDAEQRQADLRLDQRDAAVELGAVVPGKPDESELISRVMSDDPDLRMPPPRSKKTLSVEEKETLRRWIAEGGKYESLWSLAPVGDVAVPALRDGDERAWAKNAIDAFALRRLREANLHPAPRLARAADPTPQLRFDGPAADTGGDRRVPGGPFA